MHSFFHKMNIGECPVSQQLISPHTWNSDGLMKTSIKWWVFSLWRMKTKANNAVTVFLRRNISYYWLILSCSSKKNSIFLTNLTRITNLTRLSCDNEIRLFSRTAYNSFQWYTAHSWRLHHHSPLCSNTLSDRLMGGRGTVSATKLIIFLHQHTPVCVIFLLFDSNSPGMIQPKVTAFPLILETKCEINVSLHQQSASEERLLCASLWMSC